MYFFHRYCGPHNRTKPWLEITFSGSFAAFPLLGKLSAILNTRRELTRIRILIRASRLPARTGLLLFLCTISIPASANQDWVEVHGTVRYNGAPVCAMVLINGQNMFSCSEGDEFGRYRLQVPLDSISKITIQAFVAGLAPFRLTTDASDLDIGIEMQAPDPVSKPPAITINAVSDDSTPPGWARIAGMVSLAETPLCGAGAGQRATYVFMR